MGNLFAFRATQPIDLMHAPNPVGDDNDYWLRRLSKDAGVVVAGWGNHGVLLNRSVEALSILPEVCCLKINKSAQPGHPLYLKKSLNLFPFSKGK